VYPLALIASALSFVPRFLGRYSVTEGRLPAESEAAGVMAAGVTAIVNVLATNFAFRYIDTFGRRKLAIGGFSCMLVFLVIGAIGNATLTGSAQLVVLMVSFALFI